MGEGASHLSSLGLRTQRASEKPWHVLRPVLSWDERGSGLDQPSKNPAGLGFLFASPIVLHPAPPHTHTWPPNSAPAGKEKPMKDKG